MDDERAEQLLKEKDYLQDKSIKKVSLATIKRRKKMEEKKEDNPDMVPGSFTNGAKPQF